MPPGGSASALQSVLDAIANSVRDNGDDLHADESTISLVEDAATVCLKDITIETIDLVTSSLFSKENGITILLRKISEKAKLKRSLLAGLDLLNAFTKKHQGVVLPYYSNIEECCTHIYGRSSYADVKVAAIDCLAVLIQVPGCNQKCENVDSLIRLFYKELPKTDTQVKPTVKHGVLVLLGVLSVQFRPAMQPYAEGLAEKIVTILNFQMNKSKKSPEASLIAGSFKALTYFLGPFDRSAHPDQAECIFKCMAKAVDPSIDNKRYDVPKSAAMLLAKHGEQFRKYLLESYKEFYQRLTAHVTSKNLDMRRAAVAAIETFLQQISEELVDPEDSKYSEVQRKAIFMFFLKDFLQSMKNISNDLKSVSQSIRSYGYFAAPLKLFLGGKEVKDMLNVLLEKCIQVCLSDTETIEGKALFLPSFIRSLASIVRQTDSIDDSTVEPFKMIVGLAFENYPKLTPNMQHQCGVALSNLLQALTPHGPIFQRFLSHFVYQSLLQSCVQPPVVTQESTNEADAEIKQLSYRDYVPLWKTLLNSNKYRGGAGTSSGSSIDLERCMYDQMIRTIILMCDRLDLSTSEESQIVDETVGVGLITPTKAGDFQVLINLTDLFKDVLLNTHNEMFCEWTFTFIHSLIALSSKFPLASGLYKLLTYAMHISDAIHYFDDLTPSDEDAMDILSDTDGRAPHLTASLLSKYLTEIVARMKQFKDDLLISCLLYLFSLPISIANQHLDRLAEAMQISLSLGLSYPPLVKSCISTLKQWSKHLPEESLKPQLQKILPYLDTFLQSVENEATGKDDQGDLTRSKAPRTSKLPAHLRKMALKKIASSQSQIQTLKREVIEFLGQLGGRLNLDLVTTSKHEVAKLAVSWDLRKHLKFDVPFIDFKATVYLDDFLPRVTELATSSSDRQTKVAACELLHSLVLLLLGRGTQQTDEIRSKYSMEKLYEKLFPVLFKLAVDVELVSRQLFEPLVMQLIHWLTKYPAWKETALLLDNMMEGIIIMNDSAMRTFSAKCITEYLKWSIKQTSVTTQKRNPEAVKHLLRQMYSFARHPSASKRLGAGLVFNSIYTILREEESLVDQFTMEILACFIESLALAHSDDPSLGTQAEAKKAIAHIERILKQKSALFLKPSKHRRNPVGWSYSGLHDAVTWLLSQIGRSQTECRHACMDLITKLTPFVPDLGSPKKLLTSLAVTGGLPVLIDKLEGRASKGHQGGIAIHRQMKGGDSKSFIHWFETLLASLDAYCWVIGNDLHDGASLLGDRASVMIIVLNYFIDDLALISLDSMVSKQVPPSPKEVADFNKAKCTVTVRLFDLVSILLSKKQHQVVDKILSKNFWNLLGKCVLDPVSAGFNMADVVILSNLPVNLDQVLALAARFLSPSKKQNVVDTFWELLSLDEYDLPRMLPYQYGLSSEEEQLRTCYLVDGYGLLLKSEFIDKQCLSDSDMMVMPPDLDPTACKLSEKLFQLCLKVGLNSHFIIKRLFDESGAKTYSQVESVLNKDLINHPDKMLPAITSHAATHPTNVSTILMSLLNQTNKDKSLPSQITSALIETLLMNWSSLKPWWAAEQAEKSTLTHCSTILRKIVLIQPNLHKSKHYDSVLNMYCTIMTDQKVEMSLKCELLDVVCSFLEGTEVQMNNIKQALEEFVINNFPLRSSEFPTDSVGYHGYMTAFIKILKALVLSSNLMLFKLVLGVICREEKHVQEEDIQFYIADFAKMLRKLRSGEQKRTLQIAYEMFKDSRTYPNLTVRRSALERVCLPLLQRVDKVTLMEFLTENLTEMQRLLQQQQPRGNADALEVIVCERTCCFKLIEVMYNSLVKEEVFGSGSPLCRVWAQGKTTPDSWKNMTKDLIKLCRDCKNEDMRGETMLIEQRRKQQCAALNALIAIISNTQSEEKFYKTFIFSGDSTKGEMPLENILSVCTPYIFETELSSLPVRKKKLISIRNQSGNLEEADTVVYMESMADTSLSESLSKYDYSYSQTLSSQRQRTEEREKGRLGILYPEDESVESTGAKVSEGYVEMESDALNEHECMAAFTSLLQHMLRNKITPAEVADMADPMPDWMKWLHSKLESVNTMINVKHFIVRLILNNEGVFAPFAQHWLSPLIRYVVSSDNGGLHYFNIDIIVLLIIWCDTVKPQETTVGKDMLDSLVDFIIKNVHHEKKGIMKNNLELLKNALERWKTYLTINTQSVMYYFKSTASDGKLLQTGIQVLGVIIANKLEAYNAATCADLPKQRFYGQLVHTMTHRLLSIHSAGAEVIGLTMSHLSTSDPSLHDELQEYSANILKNDKMPIACFVVCLWSINRHCPTFCDRFISKVLFHTKRVHGELRLKCLELVLSRVDVLENVYRDLSSIGFVDLLTHRNDQVALTCLKILHAVLEKLSSEELWSFLTLIADVMKVSSAPCRREGHAIFMWLHDNYNEAMEGNRVSDIIQCSKENLLLALTDSYPPNRVIIQNFWSNNTNLSGGTINRLVGMLTHMYTPQTETHFLSYATNLLLENTSKSPDFAKELFDVPLSDCQFQNYHVNALWTQRYSTMAPLFSESQSQSTQGSSASGVLRATQQHAQFTATQDPGADKSRAYDWLTQSSLDPDAGGDKQTESSSSLLFTVGTSVSQSMKRRKKYRPVGATFGQPMQDTDVTDGAAASKNSEVLALRKRFLKDQETTKLYFAKRQARMKKMEEEQIKSSKLERENRVTLYRQYRIGDLPDIQIKNSAIITPLQALAQRDGSVARMLFVVVFKAIFKELADGAKDSDLEQTLSVVSYSIKDILLSSTLYHPSFIACMLELSYDPVLHIKLEPSIVSEAGINSNQQAISILSIEESLKKFEPHNQPPQRKKRKTDQDFDGMNQSWMELARLYKSLGGYDTVHSIITGRIGVQNLTQQAVEKEAVCQYKDAVVLYEQILSKSDWETPPSESEATLVDDGRLHCLEELASWKDMEKILLANLDNDWMNVWKDQNDCYLPRVMKCRTRLLLSGEPEGFVKLVNDSCKLPDQRNILEIKHCEELALVYMASKDYERASHYWQVCSQRFLEMWPHLDPLLSNARMTQLQNLQQYAEMGEFLRMVRNDMTIEQASDLVLTWCKRMPDSVRDTCTTWDTIITQRCYYMALMGSILGNDGFAKERVGMRIQQANSAATQLNVELSSSLLNGVYHDIEKYNLGLQCKLDWSLSAVKIKHVVSSDCNFTKKVENMTASYKTLCKHEDTEVMSISSNVAVDWFSLKCSTLSSVLFDVLDGRTMDNCKDQLFRLAKCTSVEQVAPSLAQMAFYYGKESQKFISASTQKDSSSMQKAYLSLTVFADQLLKHKEEGGQMLDSSSIMDELPETLAISCLRCMNLNSDQASLWFPRLLQLVDIYPEAKLTFQQECEKVPCWQFIRWIGQMMAMLDKKSCSTVWKILERICDSYPMALVYPFKISSDGFNFIREQEAAAKFVQKLTDKFKAYPLVDRFIGALEQFSQPEALFSDWHDDMVLLLRNKDKNKIEKCYQEMYKDLFACSNDNLYGSSSESDSQEIYGKYRKNFSKAFKDKMDSTFGKNGSKLHSFDHKKFRATAQKILKDMKGLTQRNKSLCPPGLLKDYSGWLGNFHTNTYDQEIEIPGQYDKASKPLPECHAKVSGFDEKVLTLSSLRKPKCLTIRGDDEKEYRFLVKGGEDLRLDQRVEQLFSVMNRLMSQDRACAQNHLSLRTYQVIPMNARLGLIEWMDGTKPLKEILVTALDDKERQQYQKARQEYMKQYPETGSYLKKMTSGLKQDACVRFFEHVQQIMPTEVLRRSVLNMSRSIEAFYTLREHCVTSHAVICVCQYLLGIGDRHLSNFMLDMETGGMVGIDFGHAFGSATTLLPVPELMPFRLTAQLIQLMSPHTSSGLFEKTMCHVMRTLRANKKILLNVMDVFIKEPSLDWTQNAQKQTKRIDLDEDTADSSQPDTGIDWYPKEKVAIAKYKLQGRNAAAITADEIELNAYVQAKYLPSIVAIIKGGSNRYRSTVDSGDLSVEEQVRVLIDLSTDPNILGRTYIGWESFF